MGEQGPTSKLEEFAAGMIRDAYSRGRGSVYEELINECISTDRLNTSIWLIEKLVAEMYANPELSPERLTDIEELRERLEELKGRASG